MLVAPGVFFPTKIHIKTPHLRPRPLPANRQSPSVQKHEAQCVLWHLDGMTIPKTTCYALFNKNLSAAGDTYPMQKGTNNTVNLNSFQEKCHVLARDMFLSFKKKNYDNVRSIEPFHGTFLTSMVPNVPTVNSCINYSLGKNPPTKS